jgi:glutaredoxin
MKSLIFGFAIAAGALLATNAATAQTVYKSIGPNGTIVYSDHRPADGKVEKTITFADLPSSPVPDLPSQQAAKESPSTAATPPASSRQNAGVVLYAASWCGYCKQAKTWLTAKHISYETVDIETPRGRSLFAQAGKGGIPLLVTGSKRLRGFSAAGYDALFASR